MGADGGTIPKRCELVKKKKKKEKLDKSVVAAVKWQTCQASQDTLKKPIVACKLGRLYNKEAIIEGKLNKTLSSNEATKHIKSLSDVKELRLTDNKAYNGNNPESGDSYIDRNETPFICPVTSLGMNGINVFIVNWLCGCVISEKAMKEAPTANCHGCGGLYDADKSVQLYPPVELLAVYEERIARERAAKKSKAVDSGAVASSSTAVALSTTTPKVVTKSSAKSEPSDKLKAGQKRKADEKPEYKSIQDDPNASSALKSLFTTSEAAKRQPTAHWVTHNPLFY